MGLSSQELNHALLNPEQALFQLDHYESENSLLRFVQLGWHALEPGVDFVPNYAVHAICDHLEAVTKGQIRRLIINVPPGFSKSMLVSVFWSAWEWGPKNIPHYRYLNFAHEANLAIRDVVRCRDLINSEWYQSHWGDRVVWKKDQNAKSYIENTATGWRQACAAGSLTGRRGDRILCLPYDQTILTSLGYIKIGDVVENRLNVYVLGANSKGLTWQKIEKYEKNPGSKIIEVGTKRGGFRCTPNHPVYVSGKGWIEASNLRKGDRVKRVLQEDLLQLRERIPNRQQTAQNLFNGMSMGFEKKQSFIFEFKKLRNLWGALLSNTVEFEKNLRGLLQSYLYSKGTHRRGESNVSRWESFKELCSLWKRIFLKQSRVETSKMLLTNLRVVNGMGQKWAEATHCKLQRMWEGDQKDTLQFFVLFSKVLKYKSWQEYARGWKSKIRKWAVDGTIPLWVEQCLQSKDTGERFLYLPSLQQAGSGSGYVTCTPYRLRKGEFGGEQFNKSLQVLPRQDAPAEFGETKGIGDDVIEYIRDAGYEHVTYNVNVVHDHVYFAGDILVHNCDDPHSVKGADSDADREAVIQIMSETVPTRLNKQAESAIIIVMQRVHERDTSGHLLGKELGYEHLMLPMEFESERRCYSIVKPSYIKNPELVNCVYDKAKHVWLPRSEYSGESTVIQKRYNVDPRKEDGELLDPIRFPRQAVEELKGALSSWGGNYAVAGQLQQRPAPRGGGMFKKDDFQIIDSIAGLKFKAIVRGWDFAGSTSKKSPYSVGVKMAKTFDNKIVILDVNRFKKTPMGLEKELLSTAKRDGKNVVIDFPQDPGQAGKAQKMSFIKLLQGYRVKTSPETGSKEQRAEPFAAQVEGQNVYLLRGDWNDAFINEASLFPNSEFKDQIDAASRAYARLLNWKHVVISTSAELIVG